MKQKIKVKVNSQNPIVKVVVLSVSLTLLVTLNNSIFQCIVHKHDNSMNLNKRDTLCLTKQLVL
ncbi:hypothetical protein VIAE109791_06385 [Vibrio aestuarianus subsp. francensis]